jgi:FAD:protein FMN transferase
MPRRFAPLLYCLSLSAFSLILSACTHTSSHSSNDASEPAAAAAERPKLSFSGPTMGVEWHVTIAVTSATKGTDAAFVLIAIQDALARVDGRMSTYKADSEISRFASAPAGEDFNVSAETAAVVLEAQRISELSNGAFDATVMPLVDLWGFGPAEASEQAPTEAELSAALKICGWQKLHVNTGSNAANQGAGANASAAAAAEDLATLRKDVDGLRVDLSAIAKGYGVDAVCEAIIENGYTDFMVEVGGELRTAGLSPKGTAWRIGIDAPQDMSAMGQNLQAVLELGTIAVATSGDYRNFRVLDGQRITHTIDPRSGLPVKHDLASVTILAPNCMLADALATTCMVLGPEAGMKLIESMEDVECYMILRDGEKLVTQNSAGFPELTQ